MPWEAAATLQRIDGMMPDLEPGVARAASNFRFTKQKHGCGAQAHGARLPPSSEVSLRFYRNTSNRANRNSQLTHAMPVARPGYPNTHGARGLHSTLVVVSFIIIS